ncbi:MAG: AI-2E family transporter [Nitrospirota bacterium]|nr:AI-2E family transporter [Nitrospirota bacterium]
MNRRIADITIREFFLWLGAAVCIFLLFKLKDVVLPFALSLGFAYLLNPLLDFMERRRIGRITGIWLLLLSLLLVIAIALAFLVPAMQREVGVLVENAPLYLEQVKGLVIPLLERFGVSIPHTGTGLADFLVERIKGVSPDIIPAVAKTVFQGMSGTLGLVMVLLNLLIIPVMTFYLLKDFHAVKDGVYSLIPRHRLHRTTTLLSEIDEVLSSFVRGQLAVCLILGILYSGGLMLVGIDLALLIGLVSGLISFVPYLGLMVGMAAAVIMAVVKFGDIFHPAMVVVVFVVVQALEGTVISPKIVGEKVGLHPVAVILAVMIGGSLMGFLGILIAVPVAAAANVLLRHGVEYYRTSHAYRGD